MTEQEKRREYYKKNREKILAQAKEWRKNNPEKIKAYSIKRNKEYLKKYYRDNIEKAREYSKKYQETHKQNHIDRQNKYMNKLTARANFLVKMYKEMRMWVYIYESKDESVLSEREKILLEEYKKVIEILENCEELGVKK